MHRDDLLALCRSRGYDVRAKGGEVQFRVCVFCGNDRWNLELNAQRGVYSCWACSGSGTVAGFGRSFLGEQLNIPVDLSAKKVRRHVEAAMSDSYTPALEVPSAVHYLKRRGLGTGELLRYGISVCTDAQHALYGRIAFPAYLYHAHTLLGHIGRSYVPGENPKYMTDMPERRIVGWRTGTIKDVHVLVEGPLDGIAVDRAGYQAGILQGVDSPDLIEWAAQVDPDHRIVILLDGSATEDAERLKWKLVPLRKLVDVVRLPSEWDPGMLDPEVLQRLLS